MKEEWSYTITITVLRVVTPYNLVPLTAGCTVTCKEQYLYRPGQALRFPGGGGSQIARQAVYKSGKFVSPTHLSLLPPRKYTWEATHFCVGG
jgi:hypothetical protein